MKKILTLMVIAGSLHVCQAQNYTAVLTGSQEVPPNTLTSTDGTYGLSSFSLSGTTLTVTAGFYGYSVGDPTSVTLNDAPAGFNALSPLFSLTIDPDQFSVGGGLMDGTFSGSTTLTPQEITDLDAGDLYVNIQSASFSTPGEIRGQISQVPEPATMTLMGLGSMAWLAMKRKKA